jgi:hypothetical protein
VKLALFALLPGDADEYITGGAFKGQRGFSPATSTAVVGVDLVGRQFNRVPTRHSPTADLWLSGGWTMTEGPGAKDAPQTFTDEERARG